MEANPLVPRRRFQQLVPRPELATARKLSSGPAVELFTSYLRFMSSMEVAPAAAQAAGNAALELLSAAMGSVLVPNEAAVRDGLRVKAKEYIEAHNAHLSRAFRAQYNMSPSEARLAAAARLGQPDSQR